MSYNHNTSDYIPHSCIQFLSYLNFIICLNFFKSWWFLPTMSQPSFPFCRVFDFLKQNKRTLRIYAGITKKKQYADYGLKCLIRLGLYKASMGTTFATSISRLFGNDYTGGMKRFVALRI
ncbi:hypothetical protein V1477_008124 [Vespula maculifrons]|uniref:Uncharacterized protein n=1 Tax=Vespula maculifrons TaxID=7453 RepID=A0ABD2CG28_VESMC